MNLKPKPTVLDRYMLPNPQWEEGYRAFNRLFGRPIGWLYLIAEDGSGRLIRFDRKNNCPLYSQSRSHQEQYETFLMRFAGRVCDDEAFSRKLPSYFKGPFGTHALVFLVQHLGKVRGLFFLTSLKKSKSELADSLQAFDYFLASHVELAYKTFELNNFYETVHPRALALSTMHSVHRVISSSLRLGELLPRIGRLSAQVLKAQGCSIMLCDPEHRYLIPHFSFGSPSHFIHHQRVRIGRGMEGRMAKTGDFHLSRNSIGVPFIEEDVVGMVILWDKLDKQPFTKTDLEILKSLSEQAVVAIKNARLYEETEQLTLGSIKTINDLLNLTVGGDRSQIPIIGELVMEVGKELHLSSRELTHLQRAILLLDTGAMTFPEQIWRKKGKLTKKEFQLIRAMPHRSASLLRSISSLKPVTPIILHHRERYDGKGYPRGLRGEEIPIGARIVSVVDSFIAMISKRVYREPKTIEKALEEMQSNRGTQFDPHVVDAFLRVAHRREILVKLTKVCRQNGEMV